MKRYYFKRVTTHHFSVDAESVEEARSVLKEEPGRYQAAYEHSRYYLLSTDELDESEL